MYQEKCLSTKLIKQSDWSMVSSNEHMNHGRVRPELDRTKISKQAYSHCNTHLELREAAIVVLFSSCGSFLLHLYSTTHNPSTS